MRLAILLAILGTSAAAHAQYTKQAGHSVAMPAPAAAARGEAGGVASQDVQRQPVQIARDDFGNAKGAQYDLAIDGAFAGQTILVIDFYSSVYSVDFSPPRDAVKTKGFSVVHENVAPSPKLLAAQLAKSNQVWVISSCDDRVHLSQEDQALIRAFFDAGHGVYLWGDNDPCNADADALARMLVGARVHGDLPGDRVVRISTGPGQPGMVKDHLLSTGVEDVYEGITVATVTPAQDMTPIMYGSAGNLVTAAYDRGGKRLLVDGGFTRLSYKWSTAGTDRYIKNAAAWLANYERFGKAVVAKQLAK